MNTASNIGSLAFDRFKKLKGSKKSTRSVTSIESIEVPSAITNLITGDPYWVLAKTNRYKMLIREGHLNDLLELAELAKEADNPANWFAKVCSRRAWERTMLFLSRRHKVTQEATLAAEQLGVLESKLFLKKAWSGKNVMLAAVNAKELGDDKIKYFSKLTL